MTRDAIISDLFTGKNFNDCLRKVEPDHLREDLKQEVALIVCEWPEERIVGLHERKELEFFVVRVILNQIKSSTSPFYKKYRSVHAELSGKEVYAEEDIKDREIRENMQDVALEEINQLYWYDAELIRLYMKHGNFRALQQETGIPFISCYKTIKKSLNIIKNKVENVQPVFSKNELNYIQNG